MPWSKATGRSAASIALGLAGLLLVSGCADSGDARILRLEASADSTILKMSVAACVDRYAVETAQDTSEPRPFMGEWVTRPLDVPKCLSCNGILVIATSQRPCTGRHLVREEYNVGHGPVRLR